mgnify:CR=1 FL=1
MIQSPTIVQLPPPPEGKSGWPWTEESSPFPQLQPSGKHWPRISIVTPSYNQGRFIEETIRSVLLQGYPNLEYVVVDGGSDDETVSILRKYDKWISWWCSESDDGQTNAINKGFGRATGDIRGYINSDDYYSRNAFRAVVYSYLSEGWDFFIGKTARQSHDRIGGRNWWKWKLKRIPFPFIVEVDCRYEVSQESTFWTVSHVGSKTFDETFHFCMDVDWFSRIALGAKILLHNQEIGYFRLHEASKSSTMLDICRKEKTRLKERSHIDIGKPWKRKLIITWWIKNIQAAVRALFGKTSYFVYRHPDLY